MDAKNRILRLCLRISLLLNIAIVSWTSYAQATCYQPNGTVAPQDIACNPTHADSWCCAIGYSCMSDQICKMDPSISSEVTLYNRATCSDKNWVSSVCPTFCGTQSNMTSCNATSPSYYCCGVGCSCDSNHEVEGPFPTNATTLTVIGDTAFGPTVPTAPPVGQGVAGVPGLAGNGVGLSPASNPATTTPSASTSAAANSLGAAEANTNIAMNVGLGVGIPMVLTIGAVLLYTFYRRGKRAAMREADKTMASSPSEWGGSQASLRSHSTRMGSRPPSSRRSLERRLEWIRTYELAGQGIHYVELPAAIPGHSSRPVIPAVNVIAPDHDPLPPLPEHDALRPLPDHPANAAAAEAEEPPDSPPPVPPHDPPRDVKVQYI